MDFKIGERFKIKVKQKKDMKSKQVIQSVRVLKYHDNFVTVMILGDYYNHVESFLYSDFTTGWVSIIEREIWYGTEKNVFNQYY